jgi:hypothetical protein
MDAREPKKRPGIGKNRPDRENGRWEASRRGILDLK